MSGKKSEEANAAEFPPPSPGSPDTVKTDQPRASLSRMLESLKKISGRDLHDAAASPERSKYDFPNAPTPCEEGRRRGCKTACCTLQFELSPEDVADGFEWEPSMPYAIRHEADGYCYLLDRETFQCTVWEKRPKTCRIFDCRKKSTFADLWED